MAKRQAIKGFDWTPPATGITATTPPGMAPAFPVLTPLTPEPAVEKRPHGLTVAQARKIHATLIDPTRPDMKDLYPSANRGQRPVEAPRVPVYNSDGSVKTDRYGQTVYRHIPYLGGDPVTGPYAADFADPGPGPWAFQRSLSAPIQVPAGYLPPENPRYPRKRIAGNKGLGPVRGGVRGQTNLWS